MPHPSLSARQHVNWVRLTFGRPMCLRPLSRITLQNLFIQMEVIDNEVHCMMTGVPSYFRQNAATAELMTIQALSNWAQSGCLAIIDCRKGITALHTCDNFKCFGKFVHASILRDARSALKFNVVNSRWMHAYQKLPEIDDLLFGYVLGDSKADEHAKIVLSHHPS